MKALNGLLLGGLFTLLFVFCSFAVAGLLICLVEALTGAAFPKAPDGFLRAYLLLLVSQVVIGAILGVLYQDNN